MIILKQLVISDALLLSTMGGITVVQSHGHSAPEGVLQTYADKHFSEAACYAELNDERNIFYAAYYNDEPAGYFKIIPNVPNVNVQLNPVTKMERLYLYEQFTGLQISNALMSKAVEISKQYNDLGMWLNVWKGNPRAIRFYEKQGFINVGESDFVVTKDHINPNWVMFLKY
jgi:GNAT superfamily N-acetyltransferase